MVRWIERKFGRGAVPWVLLTAMVVLALAGVSATIFFGVSGFSAGLTVSIPMIIIGVFGFLITGGFLDDKGYL